MRVFAVLSLAAVLPWNARAAAEAPAAVPVDGETFPARLTGIDASGRLHFDADGKPRTLAAADLVAWGHPTEFRKGPVIVLADGGRLAAAVEGADKTHLAAKSARLGAWKLPLESLAGIVYRTSPDHQELDGLLDRIAHSQGTSDRIVLDNGDEIAGLIESLGNEKISVKGDLGLIERPVSRIVAVIFNPALRQPPAVRTPTAWVGLNDGTRLRAAKVSLQGDSLELTNLAGEQWKAKADDMVFYMPQSDRCVFLSDLRADAYRFLPYFDMNWTYRADRNVSEGQLRCGGRLYSKGIGVHSAARLSYKLDRPWRRFQAELGIDDSTRGGGSVGYRVFVDGKLKFTSPAVRGGMPPRAVSVDLAGARELDLVVDYGEAGDVLDHADWLNARLVK